MILKSKIILESVTCLKNDLKLTKFQSFTNTSVQSLFGDAGNTIQVPILERL